MSNARSDAWPGSIVSCACMLVLMVLSGCQQDKPWETAGARPLPSVEGDQFEPPPPSTATKQAPPWGYSGSVTAMAAQWPSIPNGFLQLPRLSPSGEHVAFQAVDENESRNAIPTLDDLVVGRRMAGVSLRVRALRASGDGEPVAFQGGCWPSWSADGQTLVFVVHDETSSSLGLWDRESGHAERKAVGLKRMLAPAIAPRDDGSNTADRIAVSAWGEVPERMVLFTVDWQTGRAEPGPPGEGPQFGARWLDAQTLLFNAYPAEGGRPYLKRWTVGDPEARVVARLHGEAELFDAVMLFMGLADPVSPAFGALAYYETTLGQVVSQPLLGQQAVATLDIAHSAAWLDEAWLVAAGGQRVSLISPQPNTEDGSFSSVQAASPAARRLSLMHGTWAVVGALPDEDSVVLVGPDPEDETRFVLMQLWVVAESS